jgi:predicted MFS family arabinose efflux permease
VTSSAVIDPPSTRTLRGLDWLNFLLADVQTGVGPFLAIYLASYGWNEQRVGIALTVGGIAGILLQTPAGALVDRAHAKRALIGAGVVALAAGALLIALAPTFWPVMSAQVLIGGTSSIFIPAICAVSLGIVGHRLFDARQGRNQSFNSAGNVVAAVSMGLLGYYVSNRSIFFFVALCTLPTILALSSIRPQEIDYERARGAQPGKDEAPPAGVFALLKDRPLLIFLVCAVMFHFANAAMLPLLGEKLARGQGRKPLLLIAFGVLPVRGLLYTLADNTVALVAFQVLDGVGAGAALSQTIAGSIVQHFNFDVGFIFLATVAAAAFGILYFFMPETRDPASG